MAELKLHLACGSNILSGWANYDNGIPNLLSIDLTQEFPWGNDSIEYVFSEHFFEHLSFDEGVAFLKRVYRVLKPGGKLRLSTPSLSQIVSDYTNGRIDRWKVVGFEPQTPAHMVNEGLMSWGHKFTHDEHSLSLALQKAGFLQELLKWTRPGESTDQNLRNLECRPYCGDLVIEVTK